MTSPLLLVLLLGAAQSTGTMSPTSSLDSNRVKATGGSTSHALRDWMASLPVSVVTLGAMGDGVTYDHAAIRLAIAEAGENGTVLFPPGKTFLVCGHLTPLAGQTWIGYGAKIKRCNQVSTATTSTITSGSGSKSFTVADASGFRVGWDVTVFNPLASKATACSAAAGCWYEWANHPITAINGNTITINADGIVNTWGAGSTLVTSMETIAIVGSPVIRDRIRILGFELDGNKSNNATFGQWPNNTEIWVNGKGTVIRENYVHDAPGEGIEVASGGNVTCDSGGAYYTVEANHVENTNGNGIHTAGGGGVIRGNFVKNTNLRPLGAQGHDDGGIISSNGTCYEVIDANYVESTALAGIGSIDSEDNSHTTLTNNTVRNATANGFEGLSPRNEVVGHIIATGNRFYDSGPVLFMQGGGTQPSEKGPRRIVFSSNVLEETPLDIRYAQNVTVANNVVTFDADGVSTVGYAIRTYDLRSGVFSGNQITGRQVGLYIDGDPTRPEDQQIRVAGNLFRDQTSNAIYGVAGGGWAVDLDGNTIIVNAATALPAYAGIQMQSKWTATRNHIHMAGGYNGIVMASNSTADGNIVTGSPGRSPIIVGAAVTGARVTGNFTSTAIVNDAPDVNTVSGNHLDGSRRRPDADVVDVAFATTIALDAGKGGVFDVQASGTAAFTFASPTGGVEGQRIAVTVENAGFDALSATTPFPNSTFVLAPWTQPAEGYSRTITFRKQGNFWIEESRTPADVPLPTATNLAKNSEALDAWLAFNSTVTADAETAPDGAATGDLVTVVGTSASVRATDFTATAAPYTGSIWLKAGTSSTAALAFYSPTADFAPFTARILSGPGIVAASGTTTAAIINLSASEWTRVQITSTLTALSDWRFYVYNTGTVGQTIGAWGAQIVPGTSALYYQGATGP